jgi:hypothetical protein
MPFLYIGLKDLLIRSRMFLFDILEKNTPDEIIITQYQNIGNKK